MGRVACSCCEKGFVSCEEKEPEEPARATSATGFSEPVTIVASELCGSLFLILKQGGYKIPYRA